MPRFKRGMTVRCGLSIQTLLSLEYWIPAFAGMTIELVEAIIARSSNTTDRTCANCPSCQHVATEAASVFLK